MIESAPDDLSSDLHAYLTGEAVSNTSQTPGAWSGSGVRLFFSHLATHKAVVSDVVTALSNFGIEAFVAHEDIEPTKEWQRVIEASLASCDAMVVFLHEGFRQSSWCDQEVGWVYGRQRPMLCLEFDSVPHGFI